MFSYLKGTLISYSSLHAIVDIQGIGYQIFIPCSTLCQLPSIGENIQFYTSLVIREFSHTLYGFLTIQERDVFEILINITGIGPKLALSLIGHLSLSELKTAIMHQDFPSLCKVPGIGKKIAERLVIELRDKLPATLLPQPSDLTVQTWQNPKTLQAQDAILALVNLGYNQSTAQKAIKQSLKELPEDVGLAELITIALKNVY